MREIMQRARCYLTDYCYHFDLVLGFDPLDHSADSEAFSMLLRLSELLPKASVPKRPSHCEPSGDWLFLLLFLLFKSLIKSYLFRKAFPTQPSHS